MLIINAPPSHLQCYAWDTSSFVFAPSLLCLVAATMQKDGTCNWSITECGPEWLPSAVIFLLTPITEIRIILINFLARKVLPSFSTKSMNDHTSLWNLPCKLHSSLWCAVDGGDCTSLMPSNSSKNHVQSGPASMNRERASRSLWSLIALPYIWRLYFTVHGLDLKPCD